MDIGSYQKFLNKQQTRWRGVLTQPGRHDEAMQQFDGKKGSRLPREERMKGYNDVFIKTGGCLWVGLYQEDQ